MRPIKLAADDRPLGRVPAAKTKSKAKTKKRSASRKTGVSLGATFMAQVGSMGAGLAGLKSFFTRSDTSKKGTKGRASARRRGPRSWQRISIFGGGIVAAALMVGYVGYLVIANDVIGHTAEWMHEKRLIALGGAGLVVQEVSVVGRERTSSKRLMAALDVARGDSIVDFDPEAARVRIEKLGWVEHASVMRRYPDEIFVRLQERRPFARWQFKEHTMVIDRKGMVVSQRDQAEFRHLPKVVGDGANEKAAELFDLLSKSPALFTRLQNAVRVRDRRWNLEFSNGVQVMLPEEGSAHAWSKLEELQADKKILNKGLVAIDLRNSDRMFVRLRPADAEFRRETQTSSGDRT